MIIGDSDSKSHKNIKEPKPNGGVEIEKDCVRHVQKRMGASLREAVNKCRPKACRWEKHRGQGPSDKETD